MLVSERGTLGEYKIGQALAARPCGRCWMRWRSSTTRISRLDEVEFIVDRTLKQAFATRAPACLILSPLLTGGKVFAQVRRDHGALMPVTHPCRNATKTPRWMNRFDLTKRLVAGCGGEAVVGGIGNTNFDLWAAGRRPQNFYMLGSMGLAMPIALGVAIAQPAPGDGARGRRLVADAARLPGRHRGAGADQPDLVGHGQPACTRSPVASQPSRRHRRPGGDRAGGRHRRQSDWAADEEEFGRLVGCGTRPPAGRPSSVRGWMAARRSPPPSGIRWGSASASCGGLACARRCDVLPRAAENGEEARRRHWALRWPLRGQPCGRCRATGRVQCMWAH